MEAIRRRLVMLKPMTAHASGHARLEAAQDGVEALVQARGLRAAQGRAYALDGAGAARELGAAEVNARGECTVSARLAWPLSRVRAIAVLAFLCIASLAVNCFMAWRLSSAGKEIDQLRIESAALLVANGAGDTAYKVFEKGRSEALNDARQKLEQINGIPVGLTGPDLLDELRRRMGLYTLSLIHI